MFVRMDGFCFFPANYLILLWGGRHAGAWNVDDLPPPCRPFINLAFIQVP